MHIPPSTFALSLIVFLLVATVYYFISPALAMGCLAYMILMFAWMFAKIADDFDDRIDILEKLIQEKKAD